MSIPPTLEESEWDRRRRGKGNGLTVSCTPYTDPSIVQMQHRVVCLYRPYQACSSCPHSLFTLTYDTERDPYALVSCPRWSGPGARQQGEDPTHYASIEVGTCETRPFDFCSSCPSPEEVVQFGADKVRVGWYSRWHRISKSIAEDADE